MNEQQVRRVLRRVMDPEVGINIIDLGLVYDVLISDAGLTVRLTMTTAACPMHQMIQDSARSALRAEWPDLDNLNIELVWEPEWTPDMMSDEARQELGW